MNDETARSGSDAARRPLRTFVYWGIPIALIVFASVAPLEQIVAASIIIVAYAWIGTACTTNALQCNRVHCWFTGPWCLLLALMLALNVYFDVSPGDIGFSEIANIGGVIAVVLWLLPELIFGRYFKKTGDTGNTP